MSQGESDRGPATPDGPSRGEARVPEHVGGLTLPALEDDDVDRRLAAIEMIGEEAAAGFRPAPHASLSPEVRYLHVSRTINQLVTDRNRAVGILLFVASLLFGASTALLNAPGEVETIVPLRAIQYWCLPVTFGTLALLSVFAGLILVRTRVGLIYEVAKMNVLMGLPAGRVRRVNPFSIFFLMHSLVAALGGASAGLTVGMMLARRLDEPWPALAGLLVGLVVLALFEVLYVVMILRRTDDDRLRGAGA